MEGIHGLHGGADTRRSNCTKEQPTWKSDFLLEELHGGGITRRKEYMVYVEVLEEGTTRWRHCTVEQVLGTAWRRDKTGGGITCLENLIEEKLHKRKLHGRGTSE